MNPMHPTIVPYIDEAITSHYEKSNLSPELEGYVCFLELSMKFLIKKILGIYERNGNVFRAITISFTNCSSESKRRKGKFPKNFLGNFLRKFNDRKKKRNHLMQKEIEIMH